MKAKGSAWRSRWKPPRSMRSPTLGSKPVFCFAHVTNQMARIDGDFEKGEADGAIDALRVITEAARACLP